MEIETHRLYTISCFETSVCLATDEDSCEIIENVLANID